MAKDNEGCIKVSNLIVESTNGFFKLQASIDFYGTVLTNRVSVDNNKAGYTYWTGHTGVDTSGGFIGFPYVVKNENSLWYGFVNKDFSASAERPFAAYWANAAFSQQVSKKGGLAKFLGVKDPRVLEVTPKPKKTKKGKATPTPAMTKIGA